MGGPQPGRGGRGRHAPATNGMCSAPHFLLDAVGPVYRFCVQHRPQSLLVSGVGCCLTSLQGRSTELTCPAWHASAGDASGRMKLVRHAYMRVWPTGLSQKTLAGGKVVRLIKLVADAGVSTRRSIQIVVIWTDVCMHAQSASGRHADACSGTHLHNGLYNSLRAFTQSSPAFVARTNIQTGSHRSQKEHKAHLSTILPAPPQGPPDAAASTA